MERAHRQRERPPAGRDLARDGPLARHRREEALPPKGESFARFISIRGNFEESSRRALWAFRHTFPFGAGRLERFRTPDPEFGGSLYSVSSYVRAQRTLRAFPTNPAL